MWNQKTWVWILVLLYSNYILRHQAYLHPLFGNDPNLPPCEGAVMFVKVDDLSLYQVTSDNQLPVCEARSKWTSFPRFQCL